MPADVAANFFRELPRLAKAVQEVASAFITFITLSLLDTIGY
jgi:hypothetical protein